jgi:hypothetical protein
VDAILAEVPPQRMSPVAREFTLRLLMINLCEPDFIKVHVHRVNRDAPLQQRLLCRMHACWPAGFKPCSGDEFQPIPEGTLAQCGAE